MSMDILVHAEGFRLTEPLREKTIEKVARLEHYAGRALRARVTLKRASAHPSPTQFEAHVRMEVPGNDVSAVQKASQPLEAVDLLVEKVEQLLRKRKTARMARRERAPRWRLAEALT
ncbi:MAG: HPF/RaiA family ribosome-associated protein [Kiritimatiellae bacterium]|nr:HPF/RaiA family ribosome-associated protein [Kiritimatiellia bacterium]MDW8459053.1 HPF/RaiA family ribosome-associated protein [Verrucomicrobiota bacterium]